VPDLAQIAPRRPGTSRHKSGRAGRGSIYQRVARLDPSVEVGIRCVAIHVAVQVGVRRAS
jgi:hypothetical protein